MGKRIPCFICHSQIKKKYAKYCSNKSFDFLMNSSSSSKVNKKDSFSPSCPECFQYLSEAKSLLEDDINIQKRLEELRKIVIQKMENRPSGTPSESEKDLELKEKSELPTQSENKNESPPPLSSSSPLGAVSEKNDDDTVFDPEDRGEEEHLENDGMEFIGHEVVEEDDKITEASEFDESEDVLNYIVPEVIFSEGDEKVTIKIEPEEDNSSDKEEEIKPVIKPKRTKRRSTYAEKIKALTCPDMDMDMADTTKEKESKETVKKSKKDKEKEKIKRQHVCTKCSMKFAEKRDIDRHLFRVHKTYANKCPEEGCNAEFCSKENLDNHIIRTHKKELLKYPCNHCALVFPKKHLLESHIKYFTAKQSSAFKCTVPDCTLTKSFCNKYALERHLKSHDPDHIGSVCDECGLSYRDDAALKIHQRKVHNDQVHSCPHCPFTTKYANYIEYHIQTHAVVTEESLSYICDVCGKGFKSMQNLKYHRVRHEAAKPFVCEVEGCGKGFKTKANLRNHKLWHTPKDQRPFRCQECSKTFVTLNVLKVHSTLHKGEKNCFCDFPGCTQAYTHPSYLKLHKTSAHKERKLK